MEAQANQRISGFSQGMRQKCIIMSALMHNPDVLFLDEPFTNLDVGTVTFMKALLQRLADLGKTILYCTHILEVAETLCPRNYDYQFWETHRRCTGGGTPAADKSACAQRNFSRSLPKQLELMKKQRKQFGL